MTRDEFWRHAIICVAFYHGSGMLLLPRAYLLAYAISTSRKASLSSLIVGGSIDDFSTFFFRLHLSPPPPPNLWRFWKSPNTKFSSRKNLFPQGIYFSLGMTQTISVHWIHGLCIPVVFGQIRIHCSWFSDANDRSYTRLPRQNLKTLIHRTYIYSWLDIIYLEQKHD